MIVLLMHRIEGVPSEWMVVRRNVLEDLVVQIKTLNMTTSVFNRERGTLAELSLTFDDGWESDYSIVFPLLQEYGMKATFFVIAGQVGKPGYVSWQQLREMASAGMAIGSHTMNHPYLTTLSAEEKYQECLNSKKQIEAMIERDVCSFSFPHGDYDRECVAIVRSAGYTHIATSEPGLVADKDRTIKRNALNASHSSRDIGALLHPSRMEIFGRQSQYHIRFLLKKMLGTQRYLQLRSKLVNLR